MQQIINGLKYDTETAACYGIPPASVEEILARHNPTLFFVPATDTMKVCPLQYEGVIVACSGNTGAPIS